MPLESATYISDLDPSNPVGSSDLVSSLDDHMRLVKATLQTTFPGITGAVTATHVELNHLDGVTGTTGTGKLVLDDAPTIADLTVTDSITLPAASVADAALSDNVPLLNATNVFDTGGAAPRIGVQRDGTLYTFNVDSSGNLRIVRQAGDGADTVRVDAGLRSGSLTVDGAAGIGGAATFSNNVTVGGTLTMGGAVLLPQGSASAPSVARGNDPDTGLYFPAGNTVGLSAGGSLVASFSQSEIDLTATTLDFNGNADISGTLSVGGATTVGGTLTANGNVDINANLDLAGATVTTNISMSGTRTIDATTRLNLTGSTVSVGESGGSLGFYGAAGASKPTVGGKINDGTALISLLNQLESLGLITKAWTET